MNHAMLALAIIATLMVAKSSSREFYIDHVANTFVKDSEPFTYVSGSIHPYRVPHELWEDRLKKMWAAGLNAIELYVFWNEHEPYPGVYDFSGQNDILHFVDLAQKMGFYILLRPGPYVCAEHDYGGLPWWLLANGTEFIQPRSSETNYMIAVRRWFDVLLPKFVPYLYKNGGKILTVQVENEYGFYYACDQTYMIELRDLFHKYFGNDVVLFTTDANNIELFKCGTVPGVHATIDFGVDADVQEAFDRQRVYAPTGPLVNSEFYPGWLDWWGSPHARVPTYKILNSFHKMMSMKANINFYMFFGGTNFGFSNGINLPFLIQPTTYDYDAPLSEAGDITEKYLAIRQAISQYSSLPNIDLPANSLKTSYGRVNLDYYIPLVDAVSEMSHSCVNNLDPLSFERLGQGYGFIMYKKKLSDPNVHGKWLYIPKLHDRAYIQIGSRFVGVMHRTGQLNITIDLPDNRNDTLYIFVEHLGRLNFGDDMLDNKGILRGVQLNGKQLGDWTSCLTNNFVPNYQAFLDTTKNGNAVPKNFVDIISKFNGKQNLLTNKNLKNIDFRVPGIYIGEFQGSDLDADTFLKTDKFGKGIALIRSEDRVSNLGRYWPRVGPQVTLYTPSPFITRSGKNYVVMIEFEGSPCQSADECYVELIDHPIIDSIPNKIDSTSQTFGLIG